MTTPETISARLEGCYASVVHDVMRSLGCTDFVLPPDIRPLTPERRLCGPVFTVNGRVDGGASAHDTLMGWTGLLSRAPAGHVVVCQANDDRAAHMGELSAETLLRRGVRGYIVDGGCRDVERCLEIGFPIYCRYFTPLDVVGHWLPEAFDVPVRIGEVTVRPGDYVVGDRDGVCVIPRSRIEDVVAGAEEAAATENTMRDAIRAGMDPQEAYLKFGKF